MSAERIEINSSSRSTQGSKWGLGTGQEHKACVQTDRPQWPVTSPPLSHNTSLQAPGWTQAPSPGSAQGIVEVILRLFPCSYLSRPHPTNSQTEKQTGQWPGLFSRRGRPPFFHPQSLPNQIPPHRAPPLLLISSQGDNPAVYSESPRSPIAFPSSIFQKCSGKALNRMGWGTC